MENGMRNIEEEATNTQGAKGHKEEYRTIEQGISNDEGV
jgi:hypothetical protein